MVENYVVTVVGINMLKGTHDIITGLWQAHSITEAKGFGMEEFHNSYPNHEYLQAVGFKITEDMLKI